MSRAASAGVVVALLAAFLLTLIPGMRAQATDAPAQPQKMSVGFTFSERQAGYLDLSWRQAYSAAMDLSPSLVRLAAYWDTIEKAPGHYDFTNLDWLLDHTPPQSSVLLVVGMKAPRWPEYYLPSWLKASLKAPKGADVAADGRVRDATLRFVAEVVQHEHGRTNLKYWQVENEPLDPSGPRQWTIDAGFLAEEIGLVRTLDHSHPIVASTFVDTSPVGVLPPWRSQLESRARTLLTMADVLGLDVYPVRPVDTRSFKLAFKWPVWVWEGRVRGLQRLAQAAGKQTWISEAQAEPWLPARVVDTNSAPAQNAAPGLTANAVSHFQADGFSTILLWGVEYWYMRSERYQDSNWWTGMQSLFQRRGSTSQTGSPPSA
jgi:hypothetical protein